MLRRLSGGVFALALALGAPQGSASEPRAVSGRAADQAALRSYADLVGTWRGVGQPQRSSRRGAWTETGEWVWRLTPDSAALELRVEQGKYLKSARLRPSGHGQGPRFALEAVLTDGTARTFLGQPGSRGELVLSAEGPVTEGPRRITITPLHGTRLLLLFEGRHADSDVYYRLAEVGYTRKGVAFAVGDSYPLCIVTDGRGTIEVMYQGRSYWVCCSGCKQLFEDDPAAVIAEAAERRKAKASDK